MKGRETRLETGSMSRRQGVGRGSGRGRSGLSTEWEALLGALSQNRDLS